MYIIIILIVLLFYLFCCANTGVCIDTKYKLYYLKNLDSRYVIPFQVVTDVNKLNFPIIFKPNQVPGGGKNVKLIKDIQEAKDYIKNTKGTIIAQEYNDFPHEYGVLYERYPFNKNGQVISITEKQLVTPNKKFQPMSIGIYKRTSNVIDHTKHNTKIFEKIIDRLTKNIPFLYACRYDIKAKSLQHLLQGDFQIIELNGLLGLDLRSFKHTVNQFDIYNFHLQTRWVLKRIILGLQNQFIYNPIKMIGNIIESFLLFEKNPKNIIKIILNEPIVILIIIGILLNKR